MFASMFKSLFNKSDKNGKTEKVESKLEIIQKTRQGVEDMLTELIELKENSDNYNDNIIEAIECLSIGDSYSENLDDSGTVDNIDDSISEVGSVEEKLRVTVTDDGDPNKKKLHNQIIGLQCLFTWKIKSYSKKNLISLIQNKYGEYNLNISSDEFTFERYMGNLIISYEMFHNNETELAQMKILEIGKWLEELDNGTDEFYLSIKTGLKHVMTATFIHMLFATNLTEECKWLLNDVISFANLDPKSKASVYAIHAVSLIEYGGSSKYLKKACEVAKKACDLDPNTSYWFYIYSLALTAQRRMLESHKSSPTENEISAIQHAILLSDGKNTAFNYHRMTLDRDIIHRKFHNNKIDKFTLETNLQDNKKIVQMIKTIVGMEPKDPLIVVKCARTIMTLPTKVRDFNLGKLYLTKAFQMAPNDVTVLKAIEKTVEIYNEKSKNDICTTNITKPNIQLLKNKTSKLGEELSLLVKKHKNGENVLPRLTSLVTTYNGLDKCKIIAQICSYTILFRNNLRAGVDWFITLIDQPGMKNSYLITQHFSSFGSKKFNLAELICNEIRLATSTNDNDSEDILFYYKMLTKIMETCQLKIKDADSSMKTKLTTLDSSICSNTTYQSENDSSDNELVVYNKSKPSKTKNKNHKMKKYNGPKLFTTTPNKDKDSNKKNDNSSKRHPTNVQNKTKNNNTNNINQMKSKMSKFLKSPADGISNNATPFVTENLRNLQTQSDIELYTQQLYQNILTNTQHYNLHNIAASQTHNRFFNQNHTYLNSSQQPPSFQHLHPPSLLSLRPQIKQQNLQPTEKEKKNSSKKK